MNKEQKIRYDQRVEMAQAVCSSLKSKFIANICDFDRTAVAVKGITEEQHTELCRKQHCSGHYSEKVSTGFLTNFGEYE